MTNNKIKTYRVSLSITVSLFLLFGTNSSFSQEQSEEISYDDLESLEEFLEEAEEFSDEENFEEAISYYEKVLAIDSEDIDALNGIAFSFSSIGKHVEAISYYEKVLAIDSEDIDALIGIASSLENLESDEEAISFYNQALEIEVEQESFDELSDEDLESLEEFLEEAEEFFDEENYEEAIIYYDKVLEIEPTNPDALFSKSLALEKLGQLEESFSNLEKITIPETPEPELQSSSGNSEDQATIDEIIQSDPILFLIIFLIMIILISVIVVDLIKKRKTTSKLTKT